ncbi:hypothetical protein BDR04DRAFT_1123473 [Suillus decipiens]|nr:hypothetical protein BDR04DRAFT_1123473 [Suillus decipiens]
MTPSNSNINQISFSDVYMGTVLTDARRSSIIRRLFLPQAPRQIKMQIIDDISQCKFIHDYVRSIVPVNFNQDWDAKNCLTFFKGQARALAPLVTAFLSGLAFSEIDNKIDLDDEYDLVDKALDAFFGSFNVTFMERQ